MGNKKTEVFVNLTKNDTLVALDDKILKGSLVFDSLNPFPGYYHELPTDASSMFIYMVLGKQYPLEEILRATQNIEKQYDWSFDAGKAYITIGSTNLDAIRLRHLPELDLVEKIQEAYVNQGITFLMGKKHTGKLEARTKIVKFLVLEELTPSIYMNANDNTFAYIYVSRYLDAEEFIKVSMDVKYNWEGHEFDAANASVYSNGKLYEAVRIRSDKMDIEYLSAIQKLYEQKMK
ncbi:hypothetical protein INQ51_18630 [Maribellus sp. CM-23]|uniref:hypothetical protein n=1 Tax=Maribellus sp. CM-23 TaxID=2781026 RepID=UPI001F399BBE|nr:hypothetical protein [Maribellus sp. CM-23]MCE4566343.1 hypothetical protein [Maribellus sp. CM-23]